MHATTKKKAGRCLIIITKIFHSSNRGGMDEDNRSMGLGGDQNDPSLSMGQMHNTLQNISTGPNHSQEISV